MISNFNWMVKSLATQLVAGKTHSCTGTEALYRPTAHMGVEV